MIKNDDFLGFCLIFCIEKLSENYRTIIEKLSKNYRKLSKNYRQIIDKLSKSIEKLSFCLKKPGKLAKTLDFHGFGSKHDKNMMIS